MPSKIRVLDEHTINKIAAGEVIENPASVVKELVENALDAGAKEICIEIKGGGRQLIRITDNGSGMNSDDALLCLERHATSKIKDVHDIYSIDTMGFRGEAVPSIAAISKFNILTCDSENQKGTMVVVEAGKILKCCPVVRAQGTTIEVKSLFFNVPVRRKFQKSPAYDANEILKMVSAIALGYPTITFQLISDQKNVLSTHTSTGTFIDRLGERIKDVLGIDFLESTCSVEIEQDGYSLKGFIGQPSQTRHNRSGQYLFINQRAISSPLISFAVREGYGTMLSTGRHPLYLLHLTIPGTLVDVNVHPQKREVRLRQEQVLKEMVIKAVNTALQNQRGLLFPQELPTNPVYPFEVPQVALPPQQFKRSFIDFPQNEMHSDMQKTAVTPPQESIPPYSLQKSAPLPQPSLSFEATKNIPSYRVLSTLKSYIILDGSSLQKSSGICLVSHKAAHARIIFEKLIKQSTGPQEVQALLIPHPFSTTPVDSPIMLENLSCLNQLNIGIHQTGPNAFLINEIPQFFGNTDLDSFVSELIQHLRAYKDTESLYQEQAKRIAVAASRAAISTNVRLTLIEAQSLIDQLMRCEAPYQCPSGKPTMTFLSEEELEKRFLKN